MIINKPFKFMGCTVVIKQDYDLAQLSKIRFTRYKAYKYALDNIPAPKKDEPMNGQINYTRMQYNGTCQYYSYIHIRVHDRRYQTRFSRTVETDNIKNTKDLYKILKECIIAKKKKVRQAQSKLSESTYYFQDNEFLPYTKTDVVFTKPGQILQLKKAKRLLTIFEDKKPTKPNRYVGIELEFCAEISRVDLAQKLFDNNLNEYCQLKDDGSLRPKDNETGFELAVLFLESEYHQKLKILTKLLEEIGAKTEDRRCGLHVHLDMRKRKKELVYNNLVACQDALWNIVNPLRTKNSFCQPVKTRKFPKRPSSEREDRYKTINAMSYFRHKTLEVRMHEGTVDFVTIANWVDLLIKISNFKTKLKNPITSIKGLKDKIKLNGKKYKYCIDKSTYWKVTSKEMAETIGREQLALGDHGVLAYIPTSTLLSHETVSSVVDAYTSSFFGTYNIITSNNTGTN